MQIKSKKQTLWIEKYRPDNLEQFVGNIDIKNKLQYYIDNKDIPHLLFAGRAGTGKTTAAKIIVKQMGEDYCEHLYINASDENSIEVMRNRIRDFASSVGMRQYKIVILDEADFLTPQAQAALRNIMETFSKNCRFILTCNYAERIIEPIQSRCQIFKMFPPSKKEVAIRMAEILVEENIKFKPTDVAKIVELHYPDIRATIGAIDKQTINGQLSADIVGVGDSDYKNKLIDYLSIPDKKEAWKMCRQLLLDAGLRDYTDVYRYLYDNLDKYAKGKLSAIILILADFQYKDALIVDKEINFSACVVSILMELHR